MNSVIGPVLLWAKENKKKASALHEERQKQSRLMRGAPLKMDMLLEEVEATNKFKVPAGFTGKDYVSMLVSIDAEIEHGLMLQYLYGAYSLGGPQVPEKYQERVRNWQNIILGIAKEEMGHFISVQNVLKIMGAPLNFGRESYPWDTEFYPFPFTLERLTLRSLAKYVYAEASTEWLESDDPTAKEVVKLVNAEVHDPHNVGAMFKIIISLVKDPSIIPDEVFQASTYPYQAKFDEWGRGYAGGARGATYVDKLKGTPDVLVVPLASRDDTVNALKEIAEQGEGDDPKADDPSHFERFLYVYEDMKKVLSEADGKWHPSRNVASNPYIDDDLVEPDLDPAEGATSGEINTPITNDETKLWANLFNIRYRMLLNFLNHSFLLEGGLNNTGARTPRGMIINSTFGEMYNLRSIAVALVDMPVSDIVGETIMAGPPFTIPYTMELPFGEHNRWRLHQDLIESSRQIIDELLSRRKTTHRKYLKALKELDNTLLKDIASLTEYAA